MGREGLVHSAVLTAEHSPNPMVLHALRLASEDKRASHERASAGSPLELLVRKTAVDSETARRIGWTVRGDGVVVLETRKDEVGMRVVDRHELESSTRALGETAEDGFRLTSDETM